MGKMKEKEVDGKLQLVESVDTITARICAICQKVEKAQDSYKSIMEDVYLIYKYKPFKALDMNFSDYMKEKTGMSKATSHRLVNIWKNRIKLLKGLDYEKSKKMGEWYDSLSMRQLLFISEKHQIDNLIEKRDNEVDPVMDALLEDCQRDYENIVDLPPEAKKKTDTEVPAAQADEKPEIVHTYTEVIIQEESDLDQLVETLTSIFEEGYQIDVRYIVVN